MSRYEYGGGLAQLVVAADTVLGGALKAAPGVTVAFYDKPEWDVTRALLNDYLVDDGDGNIDVVATTIVVDSNGYLPVFQAKDNVNPIYSLQGYRLNPNNRDTVDIPNADTITRGVTRYPTAPEAVDVANTTTAMTPRDVGLQVDAHDADGASHSDIRDAVTTNANGLAGKANLVAGAVPFSELPASTSATPDTLAQRQPTSGAVKGGFANADDDLLPKLQALQLIAASTALGTEVLAGEKVGGLPLALADATTWVSITSSDSTKPVHVSDAASGDEYEIAYAITYRAATAAGIQVRFRQNASAETNVLNNPSIETNTTGWAPTSACTFTRVAAAGADGSSAYGLITAVTSANSVVTSEWHAATPTSLWTAGAKYRWDTGPTPKVCRADIQFGDSTQTAIPGAGTVLGTGITPGTGAFTQSTADSTAVGAPSGTVWARVRLVVQAPAVGDKVRVDSIQLEPSRPLPAYGSTGGGGASALEIYGAWGPHLVNAATDNDGNSKVTPIRYPAVAGVTAQAGGAGATTDAMIAGGFRIKVGGTGLTGQIIGLEAAKRIATGVDTTIEDVRATIVQVA